MLELHFKIDDKEFGDIKNEIDIALRAFVHDIAFEAQRSFERHVPRGHTLRTLQAISEGRVNKTPLGYTVSIGIDPIEDVKPGESPDYPLFVHEGTGFLGERGDFIFPEHGNVMAFEKVPGVAGAPGETVFTRWVVGQRPQPYLEDVEKEVNAYIEVKKHEFAAIVNSLL